MVFSNKLYDVVKWVAQFFLPGSGALYFALSKIWGFPYGEEVVGTITAIDVFLGLLLGISSANYKGEGNLVVMPDSIDENKEIYRLELLIPIDQLTGRKALTFKVNDDGNLGCPS